MSFIDIERVCLQAEARVIEVLCAGGVKYVVRLAETAKTVYYDMVRIVAEKQNETGKTISANDVFESLTGPIAPRPRRQHGNIKSVVTLYRNWTDHFHNRGYWRVEDPGQHEVPPEIAKDVLQCLFCCAGGSNERAQIHLGAVGYTKIILAAEGIPDQSILARIIDVEVERQCHVNLIRRQHLHDVVDDYLRAHDSGYLLIEGGVGTGKTAFVIDRVRRSPRQPVIHHLVRRNMGDWDDPDAILTSLYAQLLRKYEVPEPEAGKHLSPLGKLNVVLSQISTNLPSGDKEIVYLDGLDEAFGPTGRFGNAWPGVLPATLPKGIHFILTARPGEYLEVFVDPAKCTRVRIEDWAKKNRQDVRSYINKRNSALSLRLDREFIDTLADRSQGNFLFAAWVIPASNDSGNYCAGDGYDVNGLCLGHKLAVRASRIAASNPCVDVYHPIMETRSGGPQNCLAMTLNREGEFRRTPFRVFDTSDQFSCGHSLIVRSVQRIPTMNQNGF
jgi:hypothetical protein